MRRLIVLAVLAGSCAAVAAEDKAASPASAKGNASSAGVTYEPATFEQILGLPEKKTPPGDDATRAPGAKGKPKYTLVSVQPLTPSQVFDKVKNSVVVVKSLDANGNAIGQGSGVLLPSGKIGTNCHVVKNGARFQVGGGRRFVSATLWGSDQGKDICLLEARGLNAKPAQLGETMRLKVGDPVYAVGAPRGLELSLSNGIVSQLRGGTPPFIQTTAAISPGSSGGGLFDAEGRLVGFTTLYIEGGQSLNFAMPVEWAGEIQRGMKAALGRSEDPANQSWIVTARGFESRGAWNDLLSLAKGKSSTDAKDVEAWYFVALANFRLKNRNDALDAARMALNLNRDHWRTWFVLGNIYASLWPIRSDDAITALRQVLRLQPDHVESMVDISYMYRLNKQPNIAMDLLDRAVALEPRNSSAWSAMGAALFDADRPADAARAYKRAIDLDPRDSVSWFGMGRAYVSANQIAMAIEAYKESIRVDDSSSLPWVYLGNAYLMNCQVDDATRVHEHLAKNYPNDFDWGFDQNLRDVSGLCKMK